MLNTMVLFVILRFCTALVSITVTDHGWVVHSCGIYCTSLCPNPHHAMQSSTLQPVSPLLKVCVTMQTASLWYNHEYFVLYVRTISYCYLYTIMFALYMDKHNLKKKVAITTWSVRKMAVTVKLSKSQLYAGQDKFRHSRLDKPYFWGCSSSI